jgi:hypothetical protein
MKALRAKLQAAGETLKHEMVVWAWISAYLFILFSAILLYGWEKAGGEGRAVTEVGLAAVQAVVLGKFVLFGKVLGLGKMPREEPLFLRVLRRTLGVLIVVAVFMALEEMAMSVLRGGSLMDGIDALLARGVAELVITTFLMFLILLPLSVLLEFARHIPPAEIRRLLFGRRGTADPL